MKKLIALFLVLMLCVGFCACGGSSDPQQAQQAANPSDSDPDIEFLYEQVKQMNVLLDSAAIYRYRLEEGCRENMNLLFVQTGDPVGDPTGLFSGHSLYMLDMDTGIWYDNSFLNWDIMSIGTNWNFETKEISLMCFYTFYEQRQDQAIIWSEDETFVQLDPDALSRINQRLVANAPSSDSTPTGTPSNNTSQLASNDTPVAAPTVDLEYVYEQAYLLHIRLNAAAVYQGTIAEENPETVNLLFLQSTAYLDVPRERWMHSAPGIYLVDMDTGSIFAGNFVNWDIIVKGNQWNYDTKEAALMCYFTLFEQSQTMDNEFFSTGNGQLVFLNEAELETINQKLLINDLTRQRPGYPYASIEEEPRKLSDDEIDALYGQPSGLVKTAISTVPDAIAYLDMRFPELWMGLPFHNGIDVDTRWYRSADEILSSSSGLATRSCIVNCLTYLLDDDYEIESLIAFWPDSTVVNEDSPEKSINCIKTADGYLFFDPVLRMQGDVMSRYEDLLPEMKCSSVAEYVERIRQNPSLSSVIKYIFKNTGGVRMDYVRSFADGYTITTNSPGIELVYYSVDPQEPGQHIKPENISSYKLSSMLGGVTLSADEVTALVGQEPAVIREEIKTAGDLLMFMLAARITEGDGCYCTEVNGHTWHWNMDARTFLRKGRGGCGDCANLANYMLDGDYEEVGFMDHTYYPGFGGSHVYTYILYENQYYIVDFSWFIFENYEPTKDYPVTVLNALDQWAARVNQVYQNVCLAMAYDTPGMQYPVIFGEAYQQEFGGVYYILPEGAEYTVLYEAPDGYQYHHIPFNTYAYDWNTFGVN